MSIKYINNRIFDIVEGNGLYLITMFDYELDNEGGYIITTDSLDGLNSDGTFTGNIIHKEAVRDPDGYRRIALKGAYGNGIYLFVFLNSAGFAGSYSNSVCDDGRLLVGYTLDGINYNYHYTSDYEFAGRSANNVVIDNNSTVTSEVRPNYYHPTVESVDYVGNNEFTCTLSSHVLSIVINPDEVGGSVGIAASPELVYSITDKLQKQIDNNKLGDHSSETTEFGIGTTKKYGHVKLVNELEKLTVTNSDPATRLGLSSYVSDFIIMDDGNYLYIDMDRKMFQPMNIGDTDYLQTFILSPDETDENNIQLVSTGIERISSMYSPNIFKVNNYYIVFYATSLAYSTDGLSWTVKNYSDLYNEPYSDTLYEHGDILVSIEYFPSTNNYIVGTQNGLITLDENFEFIQYEQVRKNGSNWGFTRKHVFYSSGEDIRCIVCKSAWAS